MPVGRVESMYMYPMSFIEFLYALNYDSLADEILKNTHENTSESVHRMLLSLVGEYLAVGGMPAVVKSWRDKKDLFECSKLQNMLVDSYRQDFNKYAKKHQLKYLDALFEHIPKRLGKKFKYREVGEYQKRELEPCLNMLILGGIATKVSMSAGNGIPLGAEASLSDFKALFLDVALSQVVLGLDVRGWIINPLEEFINKVELVEAFVGQEILAYSNPFKRASLYYWQRAARGS